MKGNSAISELEPQPSHPAETELTKMVLLSMPRTGSTMITRQLSVHKDAYVLGAIFSEKGWHGGGLGQEALKAGLDERWDELDYRVDNRDYLMQKLFASYDARCIGFKHHLSGNPRITQTVLDDDSISKIILDRTNLLACYSSNKLAILQRELSPEDERPKSTIFDPDEFGRYVFRRRKVYERWKASIEDKKARCLSITYAEARTEVGIARVMDFLGLSHDKVERPTKKRNSDDVLSRFSNPGDAEAYLRQEGLEEWATELPADE